MVVESQALFLLSFTTFDTLGQNSTTTKLLQNQNIDGLSTQDKEHRFEQDQLTDRVMVKDMGKGVSAVELSFENPIVISQRFDEELLTPANFTNPK